MPKRKYSTIEAAGRLMTSMEIAIDNMIKEVAKPVDPDATGSARKDHKREQLPQGGGAG